jgi:hypothetical protein
MDTCGRSIVLCWREQSGVDLAHPRGDTPKIEL